MNTFGIIAHRLIYTVIFFAVGVFVTILAEGLVGPLAPILGALAGGWAVSELPF